MNSFQPFKLRLPHGADWTVAIFLAIAAPLIAACIQSVCALRSDEWNYQALIGGAYFQAVEKPGSATLSALVYIETYGIFTFLVLLPFWNRTLYRLLVWIGCIALLEWYFYITEHVHMLK